MHDRDQEPQQDHAFIDDPRDAPAPQPALALDEDERLPWLESADDDEDEGGVDSTRLVRFALFGVALLALVAGGLWLAGHRTASGPVVAEGGIIKAPAQPYKEVPRDTGGKTYAGTGDSAYAVSAGKNPSAHLGEGGGPAPSIAAGANTPETAETGGVGVQVGAYTSAAAAEAGWTRLSGSSEALKGVKHRVVEGSADIGTVYRLQAVAGDLAAANTLCAALKASGIACQVKR